MSVENIIFSNVADLRFSGYGEVAEFVACKTPSPSI